MTKGVALVTGSSRGIGLAAAIAMARAGFAVAINSRSDGEELIKAAGLIESEGGKVAKAAFDVSDIKQYENILDRIEAELGPLTTLVNNAMPKVQPKKRITF